jgi:hypothetical protein
MLTDFIDPKKITYLPNTAGCFTAEDAIRTLRLAREAGGWDLVKLEVLGEARTLYPDMRETLKACEVLAGEGFRRWSIASTIRLRPSSWKAPARWRSCRWARRSARAGHPEPGDHPPDRRRRQRCRCWSMPGLARPAMRPWRWNWAATGC